MYVKALVIAEHPEAARELAAGARTLADEVALVAFGEAPENVADAAYIVEVPEGAVADDAYLTIQSVYEKEQPAVVLAEPTRHVKSVLGRLAAAAGAAAITDVTAFEDGGALKPLLRRRGRARAQGHGRCGLLTRWPLAPSPTPSLRAAPWPRPWPGSRRPVRCAWCPPASARRAAPICSRPRPSWPAAAGSPRKSEPELGPRAGRQRSTAVWPAPVP